MSDLKSEIIRQLFREACRMQNGIRFRQLFQASLLEMTEDFYAELWSIATDECKGIMKNEYFRTDDVRKEITNRVNRELIIRQAAENNGGVVYKGADLDTYRSLDEQGFIKE